jgi:hypothetical protein
VTIFDQALVYTKVDSSKAPELGRLSSFVIEAILIENALYDRAEDRPDALRSA